MDNTDNYASFLIRVWREMDGAPHAEEPVWAGEVESVQTGLIVPFKGLQGLVELLVGQLTEQTGFLP